MASDGALDFIKNSNLHFSFLILHITCMTLFLEGLLDLGILLKNCQINGLRFDKIGLFAALQFY